MILVCLALGVVGNLVMKHWPQNLFTEVRVVSIKVLVGGADTEHVVLRGELVLNILELLSALESIRGHTKGADPSAVSNLSLSGSRLGSISKAAIALVSVNDLPVGMCKNPLVALASIECARLCDAGPTHLLGLLMQVSSLLDQRRRWR